MTSVNLRDRIVASFNIGELRALCFDLDIKYENLRGETLLEKSTELIAYCNRHGNLDNLIERICQLRPQEDWLAYKKDITHSIEIPPPVQPAPVVGQQDESFKNGAERLPTSTPNPMGFPPVWLLLLVAVLIIPLLIRLLTGQNVLYTKWLLSEADLYPNETVAKIFDEETGEFLVDSSPMLQISTISYNFGGGTNQGQYEHQTKNQLTFDIFPVEKLSDGWKIRLEYLFDEGVLRDEHVEYVPQNINLTVHHLQPSDNPVLIYVITDEIYPQKLAQRLFPFRKTLYYQDINVGQPGLLNFIDLIDFSVTPNSNPNIISPGAGPIAAIIAVEFEKGEPVLRSNAVFVIRKGILHPNDILFNTTMQPFVSQLLDVEGHPMIAFQSPESNTYTNDIIISSLDGSGIRIIAPAVFEGSEEVICGWGSSEENKNVLYFLSSKDGGNSKAPYKVIVSNDGIIGQPARLTTVPMMCAEIP